MEKDEVEDSMTEEEKVAEMKDLVVSEKDQETSPDDQTETTKEEEATERLATEQERESPEITMAEKEFLEVTKKKTISQEILIVN